jgi:hypothetical protein
MDMELTFYGKPMKPARLPVASSSFEFRAPLRAREAVRRLGGDNGSLIFQQIEEIQKCDT